MNNKKTIGFIVALILVVGAGVYGYSAMTQNKSKQAVDNYLNSPTPTPTQTTTPENMVKADAFSGKIALTKENTKLAWVGRKTVVANYEDAGSISVSAGSVALENGKVKTAEATIDMNSIVTLTTGKGDGQDMLSGHLKSPDFFDTAKFPTADLKITDAKLVSENNGLQTYEFTGDLTMKGITNKVTFTGTVSFSGSIAKMEAETKLDRTKWGINYGSSKIANAVIDDMFTLKISVMAEAK